MNVEIKLYCIDPYNALENPEVIVQDAGSDGNMVKITVGNKTVIVYGEEMIKAVERCMKAQYPYY